MHFIRNIVIELYIFDWSVNVLDKGRREGYGRVVKIIATLIHLRQLAYFFRLLQLLDNSTFYAKLISAG
jgi:hypothetical protein